MLHGSQQTSVAQGQREAFMKVATPLGVPQLPLARYRFKFRAQTQVRLPSYAGSAWRGVFGRSLKKLVCVTREPRCEPCLLYRNCIYPYIFETPPDPEVGKLRKYTAAPHPFVLSPGKTMSGLLKAGSEHHIDMTLFGRGNSHLPYVVHALDQVAQRGIGAGNGTLELLEVSQYLEEAWASIYTPGGELKPHPATCPTLPTEPASLKIQLLTPLRMKAGGHLATPKSFTFRALFSTLLRRISLLTAFHTDTQLETDFAALTRAAELVQATDCQLRWHEWTRYSSRQNSLMQLGGLTGAVVLKNNELAPFWPYIWLGQWTHAGKNTSMGLGKYQIIETT